MNNKLLKDNIQKTNKLIKIRLSKIHKIQTFISRFFKELFGSVSLRNDLFNYWFIWEDKSW